jgi:hypothetical protein
MTVSFLSAAFLAASVATSAGPRDYDGPRAIAAQPQPELVPKLAVPSDSPSQTPPSESDVAPPKPVDVEPEPEPPRTWETGASVDLSYQFNSNFPDNHIYRGMVPTPRTGEASLNVASAFVEHEPTDDEPWQMQVLFHVGSGVDALVEAEPVAGGPDGRFAGAEVFKHIGLANAGYRARSGTLIQGGIMPAPLGIEWFWPDRNNHQTVSWTANGTPFYLMGAQVRQELPKGFDVFAYVVNGWQTMSDLNSVPSYVVGVHFQPKPELSGAAMVYFGPDDVDISPEAWRVHGDANVGWDARRWGLAVVWDAGQERLTALPDRPVAFWTGGGIFARGTPLIRDRYSLDLAARPEAWWDRDGRIYGVPQWLVSGTATMSLHLFDYVTVRAEYRYDHSTAASGFFYRHSATANDATGLANDQHLVSLSLAGHFRHAFATRRKKTGS